jgi:predicted Ser/Thr protein kinase
MPRAAAGAAVSAKHQSMSGMIIDGRYELLKRIGEGGMGVVYQAKQNPIDRIVAIKMLSPHLARDPDWVKRFVNEAKACSRLQHPNTIRMFDFGQSREGHLFMAMEFLDGLPLRRVIAGSAPMDPMRVLRILAQCCASLAEAHSLGIIHRDIKSDNVFIIELAGNPDYVKLLDFSVAKLLQETDGMRTQAGVIFGTPQYMSPEQARGEPLGPRSDIYALGILAYEMLTGHVPFTHDNPMSVLGMHLRTPVPPLPPTVPADVVGLVMRALDKDQKQRYPSATAMMEHAQQILGQQASGAFPVANQRPSGGYAPAPGFAKPAAAELKTVMADAVDVRTARPAAPTAASQQKTIMASATGGEAPFRTTIPDDGSHVASQAPASSPAPAAPYQPPAGGPMRTVMLPDSSGVVSFSGDRGGAPSAGHMASGPYGQSQSGPYGHAGYGPQPGDGGASVTFWILCLLTGLAVGVGAYWLVLEFGK